MQTSRLIIFFIPPEKIINGGVMSIFSICEVSRRFADIHRSEVLLCTYPGFRSYGKNDLFENNETIYSWDDILARGTPETLLLHVPEYASGQVFDALQKHTAYLQAIPELRVNLLNQNVLFMPQPIDAAQWFTLTPHVTQTTAHRKYATQDMANTYFMPTHHLSTFADPGGYPWVPFADKKKRIVLSPDGHELRDAIIAKLEQAFPDYELITIKNMSYEEYKRTISEARFTITFGEGFDGYFVEAFFTGGIAYAVYNEDFFPDPAFASYKNIYPDYPAMAARLVADMQAHNKAGIYDKILRQNLAKITEECSFANYTNKIKAFYQKRYTYTPEAGSGERLIADILRDRDRLLEIKLRELKERDKAIAGQSDMIRERDVIIRDKEEQVRAFENSLSWRVTKPLRKASAVAHKTRSRKQR